MNTQSTQYFDSVLYARAYLNEIKIIEGKKGAKGYCAINATVLSVVDDQKTYTTIDLVVKGEKVKRILWSLKDHWPTDRTKREEKPWLADINIGSLRVESYRKRDGSTAAILKGRLINIRSLTIGNEAMVGEMQTDIPEAQYVVPCYINHISPDREKRTMKIAALDGEISNPDTFGITVNYGSNGDIYELYKTGICSQGYQQRTHSVFAILTLTGLSAHVFASKEGDKAYARAKLVDVRYLKVDDKVLVSSARAA